MRIKPASTLVHHVTVMKRAREGILLGGPNEDTERFGPLKAVLGNISALYANRDVCLRSPARYPPLTNTSSGNHHRGEQDRKSPLTCGRSGRKF